ncbi:hypothetical protein GJ744_011320 [Endocarpon pusillum]|uniref:Retrotransposon Copia-like N-terminal domain-containing protein n=1 Tax=Endocarpon pusillum TaxID=364733 RepID=A0A8H7E799_9EURO|nr:hypothetical protein GJ744_011320 [Endocarpon pusillum]
MYGPTETQRPKHALLSSKENWATWSKGFAIYLRRKGNYDVITDSIPVNPSAGYELSHENVKQYILDNEEIKEDKITPQKLGANKRKPTRGLQAKFDEWQKRNNETVSEIYYGCSVAIQSLIGNYPLAKDLWTFLEKSYSSTGMTRVDSELLKLEELSNMKNVQHLASTINKAKETLTGLGYQLPEVYYIHIPLKGLDTPYSSLARDIRQRDVKILTLDDCIAQAFTEEMSIGRQDTSSTTASAMNASKGKGKGKGKGNDKSNDTKKTPEGKFHCDTAVPNLTTLAQIAGTYTMRR